MITLTTSQQAAALAPATEPRIGVTIYALDGTYRVAQEQLTWSGLDFQPRLLDPGNLQASIDGGAVGLVPSQRVSVQLANGDGWASQKPAVAWRGRRVDVTQFFLDVPSDAVRTTAFTCVGAQGDATTFTLECEELLAGARRTLVPPDDHRITKVMYPNLDDGSPVLGTIVPRVYGRVYVPLTLVDQRSSPGDLYVGAAGVASMSGLVAEIYQGGFTPVTTAADSFTVGLINVVQPYSSATAIRDGLTVTEIAMARGVPADNPPVPRFAELTGPLGEFVTPAQVAGDLFQLAGLAALVDSDALVAAHSTYVANAHWIDAAITQQRPLEDWLGDLCHDGLLRVRMGTKIVVEAIGSSAPVTSFHAGNILAGTVRVDDVHLGTEESRRGVLYRERTTDPFAVSQAAWDAGSGATSLRQAPFVGRASVANRLAQTYAQQEAAGVRRYSWGSTIKAVALEEGDIVTFTHSHVAADRARLEVLTVNRAGDTVSITARNAPVSIFAVGAGPPDRTNFRFGYQRIPYNAGSFITTPTSRTQVITGSHQMGTTPTVVTAVPLVREAVVSSLVSATDSTFQVANTVNAQLTGQNMAVILRAWDLRGTAATS